MIQSRVIAEYRTEVEQAKQPGYVSRYDEDYDDDIDVATYAATDEAHATPPLKRFRLKAKVSTGSMESEGRGGAPARHTTITLKRRRSNNFRLCPVAVTVLQDWLLRAAR